MYITPLFLNIMENESFERAKAIKEEIEKCNSLLESILKAAGNVVCIAMPIGVLVTLLPSPFPSIVPSTLLMDFT